VTLWEDTDVSEGHVAFIFCYYAVVRRLVKNIAFEHPAAFVDHLVYVYVFSATSQIIGRITCLPANSRHVTATQDRQAYKMICVNC
jgi:hypothetical protein